MSQPTRAAWIEIITDKFNACNVRGRSPLGLRGLKLLNQIFLYNTYQSQPTRAAWIEISIYGASDTVQPPGRSPLGLRGLKSFWNRLEEGDVVGRSPLGLRGLKLVWLLHFLQ